MKQLFLIMRRNWLVTVLVIAGAAGWAEAYRADFLSDNSRNPDIPLMLLFGLGAFVVFAFAAFLALAGVWYFVRGIALLWGYELGKA